MEKAKISYLKERFLIPKRMNILLRTIIFILFIVAFTIYIRINYLKINHGNLLNELSYNRVSFRSLLSQDKKILVIGSIGYDVTTYYDKMPVIGETIVGRKFAQNPGGKGDNQAVAAVVLEQI